MKKTLTAPAPARMLEQSRAEQSRAEQSRAEQSRAEQSRAEQSRADKTLSFCTAHSLFYPKYADAFEHGETMS
ncbi:hypothetical protein [Pseudoflavonifractor sp. MSJ-37]|uniref:hypothetical protein n=1 Tax=Pseudoflavonifractor sp. MSJ-37 TaxID=2841531 RepID=UPI001C119F3C|nr:hypothetical protein [Pseudoflavonifractor sp. MSJ-37]MBU5436084.1 hypothetical protein [Pseudoflavonifractor sp. MSJ-37]